MDDPDRTTREMPARPGPKNRRTFGGPLGWILLYTRGLIADQHLRRLTMFYVVLAAMVMVFVGDLFLGDWMAPREHFFRFAFYWLAVGWLTLVAALLAIYDLLMLRVQHRLVRRELRQRILGDETHDSDPKK